MICIKLVQVLSFPYESRMKLVAFFPETPCIEQCVSVTQTFIFLSSPEALEKNQKLEFERNKERFQFLKVGKFFLFDSIWVYNFRLPLIDF